MPGRYPNKRAMLRAGGGRFRAAQPSDIGIGGVCPNCQHLMVNHYHGDPRAPFLDPAKFKPRCFTCNPLTAEEQELQAEIKAGQPKPPSLMDTFRKMAGDE